ncbi:MAG: OmpH family outer membrane protein [Spirochaetaceae bacterium]|jgi:outer membrane protein|nr:OmpH family outer membrane protein [Spirochaetaceae bacterium]
MKRGGRLKIGWLVALLLGAAFDLNAQQLTRFAVVDLSQVYMAFFRDSRSVREWEERSALVQTEIDRMSREIQDLKNSQVSAENRGDREQALRFEHEAYRKSEYLKEYYKIKTAELEDQKSKLTQSGSFLNQVNNEIRLIAESEGYSMVLTLKENTGILWYSPTVDITDKLIQSLRSKAGR